MCIVHAPKNLVQNSDNIFLSVPNFHLTINHNSKSLLWHSFVLWTISFHEVAKTKHSIRFQCVFFACIFIFIFIAFDFFVNALKLWCCRTHALTPTMTVQERKRAMPIPSDVRLNCLRIYPVPKPHKSKQHKQMHWKHERHTISIDRRQSREREKEKENESEKRGDKTPVNNHTYTVHTQIVHRWTVALVQPYNIVSLASLFSWAPLHSHIFVGATQTHTRIHHCFRFVCFNSNYVAFSPTM